MSTDRFKALKITGVTVTWDIENIWQLSFDGVSSDSFVLSDHIFHLYIRRYELSVAIYLCRDDAVPAVMPLLCKLCMVDHIGQEKLVGEKEVTVEKDKEFVLLHSLMISDLEQQKEEFLPKDTLIISCSLSSSYRLNVLEQRDLENQQSVIQVEKLSSDLKNFFEAQKYTDAVLKAKNAEFPVHRTILWARCPELASILSPDGILDLSDFPASIIEDVLRYIYTGKIRALTPGSVTKIFAAANRFSLIELKEVCLEFLKSNLTENNVFDVAVTAYEYNDMLLKEEVEQYLVKHIETILPSKRWKEFSSERYKFANEILTAVLTRMQTSPNEKENTKTKFNNNY